MTDLAPAFVQELRATSDSDPLFDRWWGALRAWSAVDFREMTPCECGTAKEILCEAHRMVVHCPKCETV